MQDLGQLAGDCSVGKTGVKGIPRWSDDGVTNVPGAAKEGDRVGVSFLSLFRVFRQSLEAPTLCQAVY